MRLFVYEYICASGFPCSHAPNKCRRYERKDMQERVKVNFGKLRDSSWKIVDATQSADAIHSQLMAMATQIMTDVQNSPIHTLWRSADAIKPPKPPVDSAAAAGASDLTD